MIKMSLILALIFIIMLHLPIKVSSFSLKSSIHQRFIHKRSLYQLHVASVEVQAISIGTSAPIIPKYLPSECGIDYIPLATFLATGDYVNADKFTRENLIKISGAEKHGRNFVYWTEVRGIPDADLVSMERLWLQFSHGKFGYSVQKRVWDVEKGNFDGFIKRIGWTKEDNGIVRKLRWFGQNEFIYDVKEAPKGHLPLNNALRGTQLVKQLMLHPVWEKYDWLNYDTLSWPESK